MRICLNLLAAVAGGQLARAQAFLRRFSKFEPDAELLVLKERAIEFDYARDSRVRVIDVPIGVDSRMRALHRTVWENVNVPRLLNARGIDVYLTFSHYLPATLPRAMPSLVGISNLAPFSDLAWEAEAASTRLRRRLLKKSIVSSAKRADRVIALSDAGRQAMLDNGIAARKVVTIPIGVEDAPAELAYGGDVLREHGIARPYVLYVAHFYRYKNFPALLAAYARLPAAVRVAHQLVLVGKPWDRAYYDSVVSERDRLGLRDEVVIVPGLYGAALRALYGKARVFIFPSLIENCPNSLLEAMAAGVPVLASDIRPMPEFGGQAACYFNAHDPTDMADRLAQVLVSPEWLDRMSAASRERARLYSWDNFVMRVLAECRAVAEERR